MKKLTALLLAGVMAFGLAACSGDSSESAAETSSSADTSSAAEETGDRNTQKEGSTE